MLFRRFLFLLLFSVQMSHVRKTVNEELDGITMPKRALERYRERRIRELTDDKNSNRRYEGDGTKPETVSRLPKV